MITQWSVNVINTTNAWYNPLAFTISSIELPHSQGNNAIAATAFAGELFLYKGKVFSPKKEKLYSNYENAQNMARPHT